MFATEIKMQTSINFSISVKEITRITLHSGKSWKQNYGDHDGGFRFLEFPRETDSGKGQGIYRTPQGSCQIGQRVASGVQGDVWGNASRQTADQQFVTSGPGTRPSWPVSLMAPKVKRSWQIRFTRLIMSLTNWLRVRVPCAGSALFGLLLTTNKNSLSTFKMFPNTAHAILSKQQQLTTQTCYVFTLLSTMRT